MKQLKTKEKIAVGVSIAVIAILFFGGNIWNVFFGGNVQSTKTDNQASVGNSQQVTNIQGQTNMKNISTVKGLEVYEEKIGTGKEAVAGKKVSAHYIGTLTNGTKFDSSVDRGQPFSFDLGTGQVIKGWDLGIVGMKVGGVRKLVIAPDLAYGAQAIGPIPANSTLVFEVELLDVK